MNRSKRTSKKKKKKFLIRIVIIIIIILILIISGLVIYMIIDNNNTQNNQEKLLQDILSHYNEYVITQDIVEIYQKEDNQYIKVGKVGKDQILEIEEDNITHQDEYFKIKTFEDEYYIYYKDVLKTDELPTYSDRYKNYIVWNQNIITKETTNFYDGEDKLVYSIDKSFDLPIIIKKEDTYGVEYLNQLLYIKKDDVEKINENKNTDKTNTSGIAVLNYHFFYDDSVEGESTKCNQIICLSTDNLRKHLDYIKNNNIFTLTMEELEMYIDGYIQLPKSVVLTIDDGWRADKGSNIISEYKLNGTVFLISNDYDPNAYRNDYIEVHSHGHSLHTAGVCPTGQGGGIQCLPKEELLKDLAASRSKLNNTTVFCYPFYEYNDYSIEVLKEAGFTMAFGGYGEEGKYKVTPNINKYKLPRYIIYSYTSVDDIASYIG